MVFRKFDKQYSNVLQWCFYIVVCNDFRCCVFKHWRSMAEKPPTRRQVQIIKPIFLFNILIYCLFNQYTFQCQNLQATLPLTVPMPSFIVNIPYLTSQRRGYVLQTVKTLLQDVAQEIVIKDAVSRNTNPYLYLKRKLDTKTNFQL